MNVQETVSAGTDGGQAEITTLGKEVFIRNPLHQEQPRPQEYKSHASKDPVDFGAKIVDKHSSYVMTDIAGLAEQAKLRREDQLIGVNGTNIEKRSLEYTLDLLRNKVLPTVLLELKRNREDGIKYVWAYFTIEITGDKPSLVDEETIETDVDEMPFISTAKGIRWLGPPVLEYDILLEGKGKRPVYLRIEKGEVKFASYDRTKSCFFKYVYTRGRPADGNLVAFAVKRGNAPCNTLAAAVGEICQGSSDTESAEPPQLIALDFPDSMRNQRDIPVNPRFWLMEIDSNEELHSLESHMHRGLYLGKSKLTDDAAILVKERVLLRISLSQ